jgi:amino acid permease
VPSAYRHLYTWPNHVQIAGTIGTGLFLGSGSALEGAGPLGALLAYLLVGTVAYSYVRR